MNESGSKFWATAAVGWRRGRCITMGWRLVAVMPVMVLMSAMAAGEEPREAGESPWPPPKEITFAGDWRLPQDAKYVIQVGEEADQVVYRAATALAEDLQRRFKLEVNIARSDALPTASLVILLGTREDNPLIAHYAWDRDLKLDVEHLGGAHYDPWDHSGLDGYVIDTFTEREARVVLVGGVNGRAVGYGADTLFQLFGRDADEIRLRRAVIRDWAGIPWRGIYLDPPYDDTLDLRSIVDIVSGARANYIQWQLRPSIAVIARDEFPAVFARLLGEAHARGIMLFPYLFDCGVRDEKELGALKDSVRTLIDLGADGIGIGFDDAGAGRMPVRVVRELVELCHANGIEGRRILHCPPQHDVKGVTGNYYTFFQCEEGHRNFIESVPGLEKSLYYQTGGIVHHPFCPYQHERAVQAGLAGGKFAWWHNWPRYIPGPMQEAYGGGSLRTDGKAIYYWLLPLSQGWGKGDAAEIGQVAPDYVSAVYIHCRSQGRQTEYLQWTLGYWAWAPREYEHEKTRRGIYSRLFGTAGAELARTFDDAFAEFEELLELARRRRDKPALARLKDEALRPDALRLLGRMEEALATLSESATADTLIPEGRLKTYYLDPMNDAVELGRKIATLPFPEYAFSDVGERIRELVKNEDVEAARDLARTAGAEILPMLDNIAAALAELKPTEPYVDTWRSEVEKWTELVRESL